jgi:hypothetical protein
VGYGFSAVRSDDLGRPRGGGSTAEHAEGAEAVRELFCVLCDLCGEKEAWGRLENAEGANGEAISVGSGFSAVRNEDLGGPGGKEPSGARLPKGHVPLARDERSALPAMKCRSVRLMRSGPRGWEMSGLRERARRRGPMLGGMVWGVGGPVGSPCRCTRPRYEVREASCRPRSPIALAGGEALRSVCRR